jgi:hypothetical protein
MIDLIVKWEWNIYYVGSSIFCMLVAGAIIYIIWDSWFKKKKVNGKQKKG